MSRYSPELIKKYQGYFIEKYGVNFTDDQANEHLDSLASLYLWMSENSTTN